MPNQGRSLLELAIAVQGFIAVGMAFVLGGAFLTRQEYFHRMPAVVALSGFLLFTLDALLDGLFRETWRLLTLGGLYGMSIVSVSLISTWISQDHGRREGRIDESGNHSTRSGL